VVARADGEGDLTGSSPFDNDAADIGKFVDIFLNVLVVSGPTAVARGDAGGTCCTLLTSKRGPYRATSSRPTRTGNSEGKVVVAHKP